VNGVVHAASLMRSLQCREFIVTRCALLATSSGGRLSRREFAVCGAATRQPCCAWRPTPPSTSPRTSSGSTFCTRAKRTSKTTVRGKTSSYPLDLCHCRSRCSIVHTPQTTFLHPVLSRAVYFSGFLFFLWGRCHGQVGVHDFRSA